MVIIVGLGNPGGQYANTRHNIGFRVIDALSEKYQIPLNQKKHKAIYGSGYIEGQKVILAQPQTFMNLSGESVRELADFYKVFGDLTRVKILCVLCQSELCVCDLAGATGMTQSAISHQLKVLKQSKLVRSRRQGKSVIYSLDDDHVRTMIDMGFEHITEGK